MAGMMMIKSHSSSSSFLLLSSLVSSTTNPKMKTTTSCNRQKFRTITTPPIISFVGILAIMLLTSSVWTVAIGSICSGCVYAFSFHIPTTRILTKVKTMSTTKPHHILFDPSHYRSHYHSHHSTILFDSASSTTSTSSNVMIKEGKEEELLQQNSNGDNDDVTNKSLIPSMTERIMKSIPIESQTSGAGGSSTWEAFQRAEKNWLSLKNMKDISKQNMFNEESLYNNDDDDDDSMMKQKFVTMDGSMGNPECWNKLRTQYQQHQLEEKQQDVMLSSSSTTSTNTNDDISDKKQKQQMNKEEQRMKQKFKYSYLDYDIIVCGGTLGIFYAFAFQKMGYNIAVVEGGVIQGRQQEWNISLEELMVLVTKMNLLSIEDLNDIITTQFPSCRSGFKNKEMTPLSSGYFENNVGYECMTNDVLNLGISPSILIEKIKQEFIKYGGTIYENTKIVGISISNDIGAALDIIHPPITTTSTTNNVINDGPITSRLVIDCMGNGSPISRQQRYNIKPDGVCAVVGSCASGYDPKTNIYGDIIYTFTPIQNKGINGQYQYFWEQFPVGIGPNNENDTTPRYKEPGTSNIKTTYMFTYMDANIQRPSLETFMNDYWTLLPIYQPSITNVELDLEYKRILFAYFPTYTDSPIQSQFSRIIPVGDASGIQSPLSFGGFGALTRHIERIVESIDDALQYNLIHSNDLKYINFYTPNLSATWMFQKAMSVKINQNVNSEFVNRLLAVNFEVMNNMGQRTIKPFLQDVVRFDGLVGSLAGSFIKDPTFMPQIIQHVGIIRLVDWMNHVSMMGIYALCDAYISPIIQYYIETSTSIHPREVFIWKRRMEAWKFGSGNDYELPDEN